MNAICGGKALLKNRKPKNWIDVGYTIKVPFEFKWRGKLGKVKCDCTEVTENYQPWYGFTWYHSDECAMMKHLDKYPQMENLIEVSRIITFSD